MCFVRDYLALFSFSIYLLLLTINSIKYNLCFTLLNLNTGLRNLFFYRRRQNRSWHSCVYTAVKQTHVWYHNRLLARHTLTPPQNQLSSFALLRGMRRVMDPLRKSGGCKVSFLTFTKCTFIFIFLFIIRLHRSINACLLD